MNSRRLGIFGTLLLAILLGLSSLFFAAIAVIGPIAGGWWGLVLTAVAGMDAWLIGWCAWMEFQEWWEDR